MTHFLRYKNRTIADIETTDTDIHCVICIEEYSHFLLELDEDKQLDFINDMAGLQEIRRQWFETLEKKLDFTTRNLAETWLNFLSEKWQLEYVID